MNRLLAVVVSLLAFGTLYAALAFATHDSGAEVPDRPAARVERVAPAGAPQPAQPRAVRVAKPGAGR